MKKVLVLTMALVFVVAGFAYAELFKRGAPAAVVVAAPAVSAKELAIQKKAEIEGTEWTVDVRPMTGKAKGEKDILTFANNQVVSKNMSAKGYPATNFSMRILEDGETYTWETMQNAGGNIAFWRGDIGPDGIMRGVVSIRDKKDVVTDLSFVSSGVQKIVVAPPVVEAPAAAAPVTN